MANQIMWNIFSHVPNLFPKLVALSLGPNVQNVSVLMTGQAQKFL